MFAVARLDLGQRLRALIGWSVGFAAYVLVVVAIYPAFEGSTDLDKLLENSPGIAALAGVSGSITDPAGWLNANLYANFLPLVLLLIGIGYGAMAIAGQEDRGTLALVQVLPVPRRRVALEKASALALQVAAIALVSFIVSLVGRAFDVDVAVGDLAMTTLTAALMAIAFGLLALIVGAATGERGAAIGIAGVVAGASYLIASLAPLVSFFDSIKWLSLWYWSVSDGQLSTGVSVADVGVLIGVSAALAAVATVVYERHDLRG